ncbi:cytochrome c oxidase subunit II [Alicyclobacillus herbarius]|uniref:cytochrome c oxidase subunit II n=1 Tax=Alicyclobacillus herbarius TaxID=122960 RepID=UPI00041F1A6A|nr:cytochrome c oxidase subunit II [Alicyclobacillus herbarius]
MFSSWVPVELTQMAHNTDSFFYVMLGVVTFFFVLVEALLVTFLIRYRRTRRNQVGAAVHGNTKMEIIWTLVPTVILVFLGAFCVPYVYALQKPPAQDITIRVTGHEWYWDFEYPNGAHSRKLEVPAGTPVLFDITSADVIHGFYIPDVRLQQDASPGRITQFWITIKPNMVGHVFDVLCDQFCGAGHSQMYATGKVVTLDEFQQWVASLKK